VRVHLAIVVLALVALPLFAQEDALASAAHANDFATFDALYRAKPVEAFRPLHELWTYSVTDPGGAFYGQERYQKLAASYPSFAATIGPHRIIDSRGNVFYPSAETRAFLLAQAEGGKTIARSVTPAPAKAAPAKPAPAAKVAPATPTPAPVRRKRLTKASLIAPPAAIPPAMTIVTTATAAAPKAAAQEHVSGRGLLLVIIGLVGTGVLALIVRAPSEVPSIRNH
jgi:hypothetical protein